LFALGAEQSLKLQQKHSDATATAIVGTGFLVVFDQILAGGSVVGLREFSFNQPGNWLSTSGAKSRRGTAPETFGVFPIFGKARSISTIQISGWMESW